MVRGCLCGVCQDWRLRFGSLTGSGLGLPEGSDHELRVKAVDTEENLIYYKGEGKVWGTMVSQPMIMFKSMADTTSLYCANQDSLATLKAATQEWGDVEWDPMIRL